LSEDEKIGEVKIIETPEPLKGHKYITYLRLKKKINVDDLEEYVGLEVMQLNKCRTVGASEIKRMPRGDEKIWEAIKKVTGIEIPENKYAVQCLCEEKVDPEDITESIRDRLDIEGHLTRTKEMHEWSMETKKTDLFPFERPKVTKTIPLTRKILTEALKKKHE